MLHVADVCDSVHRGPGSGRAVHHELPAVLQGQGQTRAGAPQHQVCAVVLPQLESISA